MKTPFLIGVSDTTPVCYCFSGLPKLSSWPWFFKKLCNYFLWNIALHRLQPCSSIKAGLICHLNSWWRDVLVWILNILYYFSHRKMPDLRVVLLLTEIFHYVHETLISRVFLLRSSQPEDFLAN